MDMLCVIHGINVHTAYKRISADEMFTCPEHLIECICNMLLIRTMSCSNTHADYTRRLHTHTHTHDVRMTLRFRACACRSRFVLGLSPMSFKLWVINFRVSRSTPEGHRTNSGCVGDLQARPVKCCGLKPCRFRHAPFTAASLRFTCQMSSVCQDVARFE